MSQDLHPCRPDSNDDALESIDNTPCFAKLALTFYLHGLGDVPLCVTIEQHALAWS